MAYVVARKPDRWEVRESRSTPAGPRSRTLATFRELTPEVIERVIARAADRLDRAELVTLVRRAGAPVAATPIEEAATTLLTELSHGRRLSPALHRLLVAELGAADRPPTDSERAVAPWIGATKRDRGDSLRDLLSLADALPTPAPRERPSFPRIGSTA